MTRSLRKSIIRVQAVFMSGYRPAQWVPQVERKLNESTAAQDAEAKAANAKKIEREGG